MKGSIHRALVLGTAAICLSSSPVVADDESQKTDAPPSVAQIHREVSDALARARSLLDKDPERALAYLEGARERIDASPLAPEAKASLRRKIQPFVDVALQRRETQRTNRAIRDQVRRQRQYRVDVDRAIAEGSEHFEAMLREGRFAEAEALTFDLGWQSPANPAVGVMAEKLYFAPYEFDAPFLQLYPDSQIDPFAFDYYPYTVPWHNYRERVYVGPYHPFEPAVPDLDVLVPRDPRPEPAPRELEGPGEPDHPRPPDPDASSSTGSL